MNQPDQPKVSVIIAARDPEKNLTETLRSLGAQSTDAPFDVIVADGRTKNSAYKHIRPVTLKRILYSKGR